MISIGLGGGMGSGKSTVLKIFTSLGIASYISDIRSKELLDSNSELKAELIEAFGDIYVNDRIDRIKFANIIFNDDAKRKEANAIIHPHVRSDFKTWMLTQKAPYVINEAAILFETGAYKTLDKNILITSPLDLRLARIKKRDGIEEGQILARINSQWTDEQKIPLADYHIINDTKRSLIKQVLAIHEELLKL